jgi:putative PIN family toxin of toxin-antitoxin system
MKIFFDTNVYVAEALLGQGAERMIETTQDASWRIFTSAYIAAEAQRVLREKLGFSARFAFLTRVRILRRAVVIESSASRHVVPKDKADSPVLQAALEARADYLVTNDDDLLELNPYEGLQIISMNAYRQLLENQGLWQVK